MATYSGSPPVAAASVFSETNNVSPVTSPGNSHIRGEEQKPPLSEAPSRTVSNRSDSSIIVTDSADDQASFGHHFPLQGPGPFQYIHGEDQHDPTIHDTQSPHVGPTVAPAQSQVVTRPASPRSDLPSGRPRPTRVTTHPQLGSGNPNAPRSVCFTPGAVDKFSDDRTFDSTALSGPNPGFPNVTGPARRVADLRPAVQRVGAKRSVSIQPVEPPRRTRASLRPSTGIAEVKPRHGLSVLLKPPSQSTQGGLHTRVPGRPRDSTSGFSASQSNEFRSAAGPSKGTLEAETSTATVPGHDSGSRPGSGFPGRRGGIDTGSGREAAFPRLGIRRVVPEWGGDGKHGERGMEGSDRTQLPIPIERVPVSSKVALYPRNQGLTPVSPI